MRREPPLTEWPFRPRDAARRALSMLRLNATEARVKVLADLYIEGVERGRVPPSVSRESEGE